MDFDNSNRGVLFKNDKQGNEKRPDYQGSLNVNGQDFQLSAWIKASKKGDKYMSLSVQPKRERQTEAPRAPIASEPFPDNEIDDIGF